MNAASPVLHLGDGSPIQLGGLLGKPGGEGAVYTVVEHPDIAAKMYHNGRRTPTQESKIRAMVAKKPAERTIVDKRSGKTVPTLAWPEAIILDNKSFAGFTMRAIDLEQSVQIASIENPQRRAARPWTSNLELDMRSVVAMNLAFLLQQVHATGVVVGDLNDVDVRVSPSLIVSMIGCESMQIRDASGKHYLCSVFRPGFLAPELIGKDLGATVRAPESDLFNLAVHIYLLLLDRHPFRNGVYTGSGDKPSADKLAQHGQWRGRSGGILVPTEPSAFDPRAVLSPTIVRLFERAFEDGATAPRKRPTTAEWISALKDSRETVTNQAVPDAHLASTVLATEQLLAGDAEQSVARDDRAGGPPGDDQSGWTQV